MDGIEELFNKLCTIINIAPTSKVYVTKETLTNVLTCLLAMKNIVNMLQTQQQLKSFHNNTKEIQYKVCDTKEWKHKVVLATCELEFFYFDDVTTTLNEGLDDKLPHIKDELDHVSKTTNNDQRTNNKTEGDEDKLTKFFKPSKSCS